MSKIDRYRAFFLSVAEAAAQLSHAKKRKVGCVIVSPNGNIIAHGWNGMPTGYENECEHRQTVFMTSIRDHDIGTPSKELHTNPEVLHAEENAIGKCAAAGTPTRGCSMILTYAPCIRCARLIWRSGIREVFYLDKYSGADAIHKDGTILLAKTGVVVSQINPDGSLVNQNEAWNQELSSEV